LPKELERCRPANLDKKELIYGSGRTIKEYMDHSSSLKAIFTRLKSKVEKLEELCKDVPSEMDSKKADREHWYSWHNLWKKAWLHKSTDLTEEEKVKLKEETSVTTRYKALDL
jgi:dihydrofolate reductase